jgi:hypothetical protein
MSTLLEHQPYFVAFETSSYSRRLTIVVFLALQTCGGAVANLLGYVEIHVALTKVCGKRKYSPDSLCGYCQLNLISLPLPSR